MSVHTQTHLLMESSTEVHVDKDDGWYVLTFWDDASGQSVTVSMDGAADLDRVVAGLIHLRIAHSGIGSNLADEMPPDPFRTGAGEH